MGFFSTATVDQKVHVSSDDIVLLEGSKYPLKNVSKVYFAEQKEQTRALSELKSLLLLNESNDDGDKDILLKRALWAKRNNVKKAFQVIQGYKKLQVLMYLHSYN